MEPVPSKNELRNLLASRGIEDAYGVEIADRGWEIVDSSGTLGNFWRVEAYRRSDEKSFSARIHNADQDDDLGEEYAHMALLWKILDLETAEQGEADSLG